ncbi:hypothetical protein JCM9140_4122 [Halalkalibacter wakoensis JCM 9140]|uniref:DUF3231 family protein n=2 Tax=Halalkalibacter wakoensis TaxID=127891 RepID=W4Q8G7_9BACI|nr:hypothetical protein JCM9140_4122 [Halalkalibacter wakoensis JCM 9140]
MMNYFYKTVEDTDIRDVVKKARDLTNNGKEQIAHLFHQEMIPVPDGFSDSDVDLTAPRLFTDPFMLFFLETMGKAGTLAYSVSQAASSRKDVRELFTNYLHNMSGLYNLVVDTALEKGLYVRPPMITKPSEVEYIEGKTYLSNGLNPFNKRTLNSIEISHLFENTKTNYIGSSLCTGFAQTTDSKEISDYMKRGKAISDKHINLFTKTLSDSDLDVPSTWDIGVTDSTTRVFSDKLMMFLFSVLSATGQGNYATASTASMRYDLVADYQRISIEIALFAKAGVNIMLKHGWLEEPPQAPNRKELMKK